MKGIAVVVGAGDATGMSICRKFLGEGFAIAAARRSGNKIPSPVEDAATAAGKFKGYSVDARDEDQVIKFFNDVEKDFHPLPIRVVVHNIGANVNFPVLDTTARVYRKVWEMACFTSFLVGREGARRMVRDIEAAKTEEEKKAKRSIIFTNATASLRGNPGFSAFAGACFAKRAFAQSVAKEMGPLGIHVGHIVIDGPIETEFIKGIYGPENFEKMRKEERLLFPKDIAESIYFLHQQERSAWTFELDVRPFAEKF